MSSPEILSEKTTMAYYAKVDIGDDDDCWPWTACRNHDGYGHFWVRGKIKNAHRVGYELANGRIPGGLVIDHLCRNRCCQNPRHMEAVTQITNVMRGRSFAPVHAAKTECPAGHPYSGSNLRLEKRPNGRVARRCRLCAADSMDRFRSKAEEDHRD